MNLSERSYRLRCIELEAELERMKKEREESDVFPIIVEVLDNYPEAKEELIKRLEKLGPAPVRHAQRKEETPEEMSDEELERRARAILERRDRERAEGKL